MSKLQCFERTEDGRRKGIIIERNRQRLKERRKER
jgi:hypothetical protein